MRTTITINDKLYKSLKIKAATDGVPVSKLVEEAVKNQLLEDAEDLLAINERENEPTYPFDELVKEFKKEGLL